MSSREDISNQLIAMTVRQNVLITSFLIVLSLASTDLQRKYRVYKLLVLAESSIILRFIWFLGILTLSRAWLKKSIRFLFQFLITITFTPPFSSLPTQLEIVIEKAVLQLQSTYLSCIELDLSTFLRLAHVNLLLNTESKEFVNERCWY